MQQQDQKERFENAEVIINTLVNVDMKHTFCHINSYNKYIH